MYASSCQATPPASALQVWDTVYSPSSPFLILCANVLISTASRIHRWYQISSARILQEVHASLTSADKSPHHLTSGNSSEEVGRLVPKLLTQIFMETYYRHTPQGLGAIMGTWLQSFIQASKNTSRRRGILSLGYLAVYKKFRNTWQSLTSGAPLDHSKNT